MPSLSVKETRQVRAVGTRAVMPTHAFVNRALARRGTVDVEGALQDYNQAIRLGYKPKN
jgi:hypothetical protein